MFLDLDLKEGIRTINIRLYNIYNILSISRNAYKGTYNKNDSSTMQYNQAYQVNNSYPTSNQEK